MTNHRCTVCSVEENGARGRCWRLERGGHQGGFRTKDTEVNITFGEEKKKDRVVKEQPT